MSDVPPNFSESLPAAELPSSVRADVAAVERIESVKTILEVICRSTDMGCAAVIRIVNGRWVACVVRDEIGFGVKPGDSFDLATTLCQDIADTGQPVVIDDVAKDKTYCHHPAPARFGYQSYISVPLRLADGELFGTLWAVNRAPAKLNTPQTIGMFQLFADLVASHLDDGRQAVAERAARDDAAERQSRLQSVIASAKDYAVISVDTTGNIDNWSGGAEAVFGWTQAQAIGRPFDLIWRPEDVADGSPGRELFVAERDGVCPDNRLHVRADGKQIFVVGACRPVRNAAHELTGFVKVCRDETERRQDEQMLAAAVRRNDSALLAGEVGTFTWEVGEDRLYGDANFARIFGLSRDGTGAFPLADYLAAIHPEDRAETSAKIDCTVTEGVPYEAEYRILHKDGSQRTVVARGKIERDAAGKAVRFPGAIVDITDRKRTEAELHAAEGRYRQLFESIDEGFCTVKVMFESDGIGGRRPVDYRFLEVNPAFERHTGLHNAVGRRMRELVPDHEAHWYELYGRVVSSGLPMRFEHNAAAMGRRYDVYAARVGDEHADTVAIVFNDVTERHATAAALQASEAKSRFLAELGEAVRSVADADAVLAITVDRLRAHLRADRCAYAEMESDQDTFLIRYDHADPALSRGSLAGLFRLTDFGVPMRESLRAGRTVVIDDVTMNPLTIDGGAAMVATGVAAVINVPLVKDGKLVAILAIHQARPRAWSADDIRLAEAVAQRSWGEVERARAVRVTRESEARFRALVTASSDALYRHLPDWSAIYHVTGNQFISDTVAPDPGWFDKYIPVDEQPRVRAAIDAAIANKAVFELEHRVIQVDGSVGWTFSRAVPLFDESGNITEFFGAASDTTHRHRAEQERESLLDAERTARAEAEQAGRMKDEFLATLSHELRTPLNAIVGWTQILQSLPDPAADFEEGLSVIARNARAQTQIIEDILDMSRIISGKLRLDVQRLDLAAFRCGHRPARRRREGRALAGDGRSVGRHRLRRP